MKDEKDSSNLSIILDNINVLDAETKKEVPIRSIWEESEEEFVIVHLFRRFG